MTHPLHQARSGQPLGIAGPVLNLGGGHELAADGIAGHEEWGSIGAARVDGGAVTGRARSEDEEAGVAGIRHGPGSPQAGEIGGQGLSP